MENPEGESNVINAEDRFTPRRSPNHPAVRAANERAKLGSPLSTPEEIMERAERTEELRQKVIAVIGNMSLGELEEVQDYLEEEGFNG